MNDTIKSQLIAEMDAVTKMIDSLPQSSVIDRMSLEARKSALETEIFELTDDSNPKLCIDCKHCETRTGHEIHWGKLVQVERFDYCSLLGEYDELNTETQQLCDQWEPRKNGEN